MSPSQIIHRTSLRNFFLFYSKSIDATFSNRIGKYFNDNPAKDANCKMRLEEHQGLPVLVLYSKRSISRGEELRYDYGVPDLPWRKNGKK